MSSQAVLPMWGVVPEAVRGVLQRLQERAAAMDTPKIGGVAPRAHDEAFLRMSAAPDAADRATRDYHSVFNPTRMSFISRSRRPVSWRRCRARSRQSLAKRTTPKTVAIEALFAPNPDLAAIQAGIRALGFVNLRSISSPLGEAIAEAEADPKFHRWLPSDEKSRATSRAVQRETD